MDGEGPLTQAVAFKQELIQTQQRITLGLSQQCQC